MKLPAPVPVLAAAAGAASFVLARVVYAGPPSAAPADQAAPPADPSLAGGGGSSDLWSAFSGDGNTVYGDQGGGQTFGPQPTPYDPGAPIPPANPVAPPTTPPPTSPFASYGPKPAGAVGVQDATGVPLYSVSGSTATQITQGSTVHARVGPSKLYKPNATLRKILSGGHAGSYIKANAGTFRSA